MKTLETSHEKIKKISDVLRHEILEPAQNEASQIIADAKNEAETIIQAALQEKEKLIEEAQQHIEQQYNVFQSSLEQGIKQSLEALRQSIETNLLNKELGQLVTQNMADSQLIAKLIHSLIQAIEKEGLAVDLSVFVASNASVKEINQLLGANVLKKLKGQSVVLGDFSGGVKVRLEDKKITLDITDTEIADLLRRYVRKDFRKLFFV